MELWNDIPQLIWKTNFLMWMIHFVALVLSILYFIANRRELFKATTCGSSTLWNWVNYPDVGFCTA